MESEKASVLQEMSRGKSSALQALQMEMEKRIAEISANHEREKSDLKAVLNGEMASKLQSAEREKQVIITSGKRPQNHLCHRWIFILA